MIFSLFMLISLVVAGISVSSLLKRSKFVISRADFLNTTAIVHAGLYVVLIIYIILKQPLPLFGLNDYVFIDPLAIYEALISGIVFLLAAIYGRGYIRGMLQHGELKAEILELFYGCFGLLQAVITFLFFSNNLALLWILLELTTLLSAILIVALSARDNIIAALKYVFIASTAMVFSVIGLIILFAITQQAAGEGTLNWNELMQIAHSLPPTVFTFAFVLAFIGFASKAGIVPFHTWLPQAYSKAPSMISAVFSAALLNGAIYGVLRLYAIAHQTEAWHNISVIIIVFGVISIATAAFSLLPRNNLKKIIAFSSIEQAGFIMIGIGLGTPIALFWTLFQILAHSLIKALLFFSAGILNRQYYNNYLEKIVNSFDVQPLATWGIIIGCVALVGLPPFPMFFSKLFILIEVGSFSLPLLFIILILLLIVTGAVAYLLVYTFSQRSAEPQTGRKIHWSMKLPIYILFMLIIGLSLYLLSGPDSLLTQIVSGLGF